MLGHLFLAGLSGIALLRHTFLDKEHWGVVAKTQELGVKVCIPNSGQGDF